MQFDTTPRARELAQRLRAFMDENVYPNERRYFEEAERLGPSEVYPIVEEIKPKAKAQGLWNLFMPARHHEGVLTNFEYAHLCEIMGRSLLAQIVTVGSGLAAAVAVYLLCARLMRIPELRILLSLRRRSGTTGE